MSKRQEQANKKFDLSKWKYAELRGAINTSCGKLTETVHLYMYMYT